MKKFYYDTILDAENICNLQKERKAIEKGIEKRAKLVVYGPRNFGKTSLVKNVILSDFSARHKKNFVFFADLMDVKNISSINRRISKGFETAFGRSFPAKNIMDGVKRFLGSLRPQISIDAASGAPSLSITPQSSEKELPFEEIFKTITEIAKERKTMIVLDEFQDIAFVDEAQGLFRKAFQELKDVPLIIMGSKRHILANMLAKPSAPLSMFGEDIEFAPIAYEEYHSYIMERFALQKLSMTLDNCKYLQDAVGRVPEAVNMVCAEIMEEHSEKEITLEDIRNAVKNAVEKRQSRYEEYLSQFSENEESIMISIARRAEVKHPNGAEFLKTVQPTSRMVGIIFKQLLDRSVIDKNEKGYHVSDPLLAFYLRNYR